MTLGECPKCGGSRVHLSAGLLPRLIRSARGSRRRFCKDCGHRWLAAKPSPPSAALRLAIALMCLAAGAFLAVGAGMLLRDWRGDQTSVTARPWVRRTGTDTAVDPSQLPSVRVDRSRASVDGKPMLFAGDRGPNPDRLRRRDPGPDGQNPRRHTAAAPPPSGISGLVHAAYDLMRFALHSAGAALGYGPSVKEPEKERRAEQALGP